MSHHHHQEQHNAAEAMEVDDDYNMDDDTDGDDFLGPEARDSDSDSDEEEADDEYAQGVRASRSCSFHCAGLLLDVKLIYARVVDLWRRVDQWRDR
jgi:hypothetical protein